MYRTAMGLMVLLCNLWLDPAFSAEGDQQAARFQERSFTPGQDVNVFARLPDGTLKFVQSDRKNRHQIPACVLWYVKPSDEGEAGQTVDISAPKGPGPQRIHQGGLAAILDEVRAHEILGISLVRCKGIDGKALAPIASLTELLLLHLPADVKDDAAEYLTPLKQLEDLDLSETAFTDKAISKLPPTLKILRLSNAITDDGLETITTLAPGLESLSLGGRISGKGIAHLEKLKKLTSLELRGWGVSDDTLKQVAGLGIRRLSIWSREIGDTGVKHLTEMRDLEDLQLGQIWIEKKPTGISTAGWALLSRCPKLRKLALYEVGITDSVLASLKQLPLTKLELNSPVITDAGLAHLKEMHSLRELQLSGCQQITNKGIANLAGLISMEVIWLQKMDKLTDEVFQYFTEMKNLTGLYVESCGNAHPSLLQLSHIPGLSHLMPMAAKLLKRGELWDSWAPISDSTLAAIRKSPLSVIHFSSEHQRYTDGGLKHLKEMMSLRELDFNSQRIGEEGLRHIGECKSLRALTLLGCKVTDTGVALLANLPNLERVDLAVNREITDKSAAVIAGMKTLKDVNLHATAISDDGIKQLSALTELESLNLSMTKITERSIEDLLKLSKLKQLDIKYVRISGPSIARISKLPVLERLAIGRLDLKNSDLKYLKEFQNLKALDLGGSIEITDAGLSHLSGLIHLREINLDSCTKITDAGMDALAGLKELTHFGTPPNLTKAGFKKLAHVRVLLNAGHDPRFLLDPERPMIPHIPGMDLQDIKRPEPPAQPPPKPPDGEF